MKKYVVNGEIPLKNFTDNVCAPASFCFRALLKNREIRVNGTRVGEDVLLASGDEVAYFLTKAQERKTGYEIVYEDDYIAVADKESGVNSEAVFSALCERGETYFIHRIDRNTAGLLLFAKSRESERLLLRAFRERSAHKIYLARVIGKMSKRQSVEEAYLIKDEKNALVRVSTKPIGEKIKTEYRVLEEDGETSLLQITLHTGKTHQIRAHMAFLGHPVAGDTKYGDGAFNRTHHITRQRLVAKQLQIDGEGLLSYLSGLTFESKFEP
ncbi:MAG: RluA family pseudouridine synthase [Clostridia bacterium]|nr:RluA family pseudouridine synthase [Clostridia bacterium]